MPHALQAKHAREMDKQTVLCTLTDFGFNRLSSTHASHTARSLEKWLQVYRTKVALRAVA